MRKKDKNENGIMVAVEKTKKEKKIMEMIPYGSAYINGHRIVFNPYTFKKGKNKGKIQCYYRKGKKYKKIILQEDDIKPLKG